jgi:small-conductance mechanosensitive channel
VEQDVVRESVFWEQVLAFASVLVVAIITFVVARWLGRLLKGSTRFGLHGLERLAAPITLVVTLAVTWLGLLRTSREPPIVDLAIELLGIAAIFWLGARLLDVAWSTGRRSARLRRQPGAGSALLASRHLGKAALALGLVTILAVRMGVSEQLYLALGAIGAALTFAARAPISNAVAFAEMVVNPAFQIGDRVRIGDYRGGVDAEGEVIAISLSAVKIRSKRRTIVDIPNALLNQLRTENLSSADRRRLEFELPIARALPAEKLRAACAVIEDDLRESEYVSEYREPHVWIAGFREGMQLKASAWLRKGKDRRGAQRELLLTIRSRLDELVAD